jgi:hypothetical protein
MTYFTDGLDPKQLEVLNQMGQQMTALGFYLAGGTALTIYLKHRRSVDLDWFTDHSLGDAMVFAQQLRDDGLPFKTQQTAPGTLHGEIQGMRISFLEFRYPLLNPLNRWGEFGFQLVSLDDLACMKLSAIAQRGSRKDFLDIYALCTAHRPLPELLPLYQKKFNVEDINPVLYGLAYFDDADEQRKPVMLWDVSWPQVKAAIRLWVRGIS